MIEFTKVLGVGVIPKLGVKKVMGSLTGRTHKREYVFACLRHPKAKRSSVFACLPQGDGYKIPLDVSRLRNTLLGLGKPCKESCDLNSLPHPPPVIQP